MSNRRILIAGNWKMNCLTTDGTALATAIAGKLREASSSNCDVLMAPPFTLLSTIKNALGNSEVLLSAQDCHFEASGAHTGDISPVMLKDIGCDYVILGHSERRTNHGESDELVRQKAELAIEKGLKVIICVGETEGERETGKTLDVVNSQLTGSIPANATADNCVIAYEPVWAIGTGKTATTDDVAEVHKEIRSHLAHIKSQDLADSMRILYGGSVNPSNSKELLSLEDVDGALIGGASLKADDFWTIIGHWI